MSFLAAVKSTAVCILFPGFGLTEHGVSTLICRRGTLGVNVVTGGLDDDDTPDPEHIQRLKETGSGTMLTFDKRVYDVRSPRCKFKKKS